MPHPTAWQKYSAVRISVIAGEVRDFANEIEVRWVGGCVEKNVLYFSLILWTRLSLLLIGTEKFFWELDKPIFLVSQIPREREFLNLSPFPEIMLKRLFFSPWIILAPLLQIHWPWMQQFISGVSFCSTDLYVCPYASAVLAYCSFVVSFEIDLTLNSWAQWLAFSPRQFSETGLVEYMRNLHDAKWI